MTHQPHYRPLAKPKPPPAPAPTATIVPPLPAAKVSELIKHHSPLVARRNPAAMVKLGEAEKAEAEGDLGAALTAYLMAASLFPDDRPAQAACLDRYDLVLAEDLIRRPPPVTPVVKLGQDPYASELKPSGGWERPGGS